MGKKRKLVETSEAEELGGLRSEVEDKPHKKKQKRNRGQPLDSSQEGEQLKDHEKQREKKRKKKEESSNVEKNVYHLPGQIHETPDERDPHRVFLESLYQQLPEDELVRQWMIEWGLLPRQEATKVFEKIAEEKDVLLDRVGKVKAKLKKKEMTARMVKN